jgi:acylphosphatase
MLVSRGSNFDRNALHHRDTGHMTKTCRLRIHGRVQGVGFRYYMTHEARQRGVAGWVRNRADGTVEAIVQGSRGAVDGLIEWARHGPPSARVTHVEISEDSGAFEGFVQRPTD